MMIRNACTSLLALLVGIGLPGCSGEKESKIIKPAPIPTELHGLKLQAGAAGGGPVNPPKKEGEAKKDQAGKTGEEPKKDKAEEPKKPS